MKTFAASAPPPKPGLLERTRAQLFYSPGASLVTFAIAVLLLWALWRAFGWGVLHAVAAPDFAACQRAHHGGGGGLVAAKGRALRFRRSPYAKGWRAAG